MKTLSLVIAFAGCNAESISSEAQNKVNPIRKVVTMLQMMQNKVSAEGAKKQEIYDKFMCYCDNADTLLGGAITAAEQKIPLLESSIGEDGELKKQLDADIIKHKSDRDAAKEAIATATALREKEATAFAKEEGDLKTNIAALAKAIPAIEKGMGGFLQTKSATVLQQLSVTMDMSNVDRQMLTAFLTTKSARELIMEYEQRGFDSELREMLLSGLVMKTNSVSNKTEAPALPAPISRFDQSDSAAGTVPASINPKLLAGMCLYINLERRVDRRIAIEKLFSAHAWLNTMQRIEAVDGKGLSWHKLIVDKLFTREALTKAKNHERERYPTIGLAPDQCTAELLTLGACGCALSHRLAWKTLVDSDKKWALILEDDVQEICTNFDVELARVLQSLPNAWKVCYLGYHTGQLLPGGKSFKGPLRELPKGQWLAGLYGYLISKACAQQLLEQAFPMETQVDMVVGSFVAKERGGLAVPDRQFLLFSPPTESSMDTDIQRFPDN